MTAVDATVPTLVREREAGALGRKSRTAERIRGGSGHAMGTPEPLSLFEVSSEGKG